MNNMLTAKDVQDLLQVDRSTVYRMAEDGRLPAVKVGKQWRFPADQLQHLLGSQVNVLLRIPEMSKEGPQPVRETSRTKDLAKMLPIDCVQLIQDSHADLLGVMLVITDLEGNPVTRPSNPCGLFAEIS
ncbi:MAG: helix-turn-helix domain-containing protein, partial [Candidatus Promineifilaceae bacterium]